MLMEGSVYSAGAANLLSKRPLSVNDDGELLLAAGFPAAALLADGATLPTTSSVGAVGLVYNGTTTDLAREVVNGQDTIGTGIPAAGILGQFDDTGTSAVTENRFAPVRISSRRALLTEGVVGGTPPSLAGLSIAVSVTLTVGATYATGDFVGTSASPITFANAVRTSGGSGTLRSVTISDPAASTAAVLELWLFNATVTPPNDSAAWNLSDADGLKCVGVISIPTTAQFASSATAVLHLSNINMKFSCAATSLFGCLVTRGSPTYTGTLQVTLGIDQD